MIICVLIVFQSGPFSYKVRIINPDKKSDVVVRQLHGCSEKFESVVVLRAKLIEKFGKQVPPHIGFDVGYYEGSQHSKIWLCSCEDLESMYKKYPSGEISLWCNGAIDRDARVGEIIKRKRQRKDDGSAVSNPPTKRQKKEEEVSEVFKELKQTHGTNYSSSQLRLWARLVASDLHSDLKEPPELPAFCSTLKRPSQPSMSNAISSAAVAITRALGGRNQEGESSTTQQVGVSPRKAIEVRAKCYEQLRSLQRLLVDRILSQTEYTEQKNCILNNLREM